MDFEELLNVRAGDAKPPAPVPAGPYRFETRGMEFSKSAQKQTPSIRIACVPLEPLDGVDTSQLEDGVLGKRSMNLDFYITEDALYRFPDFARHCGVENVDSISIKELAAKFKNNRFQFCGYVVHTPNTRAQAETDPKFYANIGRTAKL